ncbi:MAG: ATP-binding protein [Gaiellaceae bacterium]
MDPIRNPYTPGAGARPPALTGRDAELERFRVLLHRLERGRHEKSLLITGLRGAGKTVLLNTYRDIAVEAGWFAADTEIRTGTTLTPVIARLARRVLLDMSGRERLRDRARQALGVLRAFSLRHGELELRFDVDAIAGRADSGDLEEDIVDLIAELGETARDAGTGVVFLMDEIQFLSRADLEALIAAMHRASQRNLPVTIVGAGLPLLPRLAGEARSYAERLFDFRSIGSLPDADAKEALLIPAREENAEWENAALELALDYTEAYPYFLQEYGKHAWLEAPEPPISRADVQRAHPLVLAELDEGFFHVRLERSTDAERRYMAAMADLGDGAQRSGEIAHRLGYDSSTAVSVTREQLLKKGLIFSPTHGQVDFTVPQFGAYIRRNYALEAENA